MQNQKSKGAAWQRRREEYLRAAGRYDDLIKEGYLLPDTVEHWSVIAGGRTRPFRRAGYETRFYLVERVDSNNLAAHTTAAASPVTPAGMQLLSTRPWALQRKS